MQEIVLTNYKVRGIKSLKQWVELSFYKKTIPSEIDLKKYNIKAIYGTNGAGKTAIITSFKILKSIITNDVYLNDPLVQKKLGELINKKLGFIEFVVEFYSSFETRKKLYRYHVKIAKMMERFTVVHEDLIYLSAFSHTNSSIEVYSVDEGIINYLRASDEALEYIKERTMNLLTDASLVSLLFRRSQSMKISEESDIRFILELFPIFFMATCIFVYMDSEDEHTNYFLNDEVSNSIIKEYYQNSNVTDRAFDTLLQPLYPDDVIIYKSQYDDLRKQVNGLRDFIRIFKKDLNSIEIDTREEKEKLHCKLTLCYEDFSVAAEFESTGIKKLIKLYSYIQKMVSGGIVFIDELDSNLHDVYLCALLDFLMEEGKGQLCFTTHNVGPMDVLKKNKKSIDFLSTNGQIYSWTSNGNYSPSKLYREGMISGSPFNVEPFDFLKAFGNVLED